MDQQDAGYDFIYGYSDKEVRELYEDRIKSAKKLLKQSKLESALGMIDGATYYFKVLEKRGVKIRGVNYNSLKQDICSFLYEKLEKEK